MPSCAIVHLLSHCHEIITQSTVKWQNQISLHIRNSHKWIIFFLLDLQMLTLITTAVARRHFFFSLYLLFIKCIYLKTCARFCHIFKLKALEAIVYKASINLNSITIFQIHENHTRHSTNRKEQIRSSRLCVYYGCQNKIPTYDEFRSFEFIGVQ